MLRSVFFKLMMTGLLMIFQLAATAQSPPGISEFSQATREVHAWYFSVSDLGFAIAAITGIIGGTRVYTNWQIGGHRHRHPIDTQVIGWFLSCLFLIIAGIFIRALYGV